jgi:thiol-disulfide isomerase/thioredoxin
MKLTYPLVFIFALTILISCSKTEENVSLEPPTAEIIVDELVRKASLRNQEIPFKITNEAGDDVSLSATFYVDGIAIEGNVFSSETIGEFQVYGVYSENGVEITTNTEDFSVIIPKRKVVIEDYTGNWCGFCPRAVEAIDEVHELTDDITIVAIHESGVGEPDLLHFSQIDEIKDVFGIGGFPEVRLNRTNVWPYPAFEIDDVLAMAGTNTDIAIAINSEISDENELVVEVEVVYEEGSNSGDKLVVYLLESGVIQDQVNYFNNDETSTYYQMGNPIVDFEQNHGLRNSLTNLTGEEISGTAALETYTRTYSFSIPNEYNTENLSLVAMVVSEDNTARNSQHAAVNENKSYE